MKIYTGKKVTLVSASRYAISAKTVATYQAEGARFIVLRVDGRSAAKRQSKAVRPRLRAVGA